MAKVTIVQTNFTAGELTPRMRGRVDVARYANGAEIIENAWPQVWGGAERRWGSLFQAAVKYPHGHVRLIPFIFSRTQAYILEFGHFYMRVYKPEGQVLVGGLPYEIGTPYSEAMLDAMDFTQGADTMIIWHQQQFSQRLRRLADDSWVMDNAPFNPAPFDEIGYRPPGTSLTLSAGTVGAGRTATASVNTFYDSDVGREILAGSGVGVITSVASFTSATITINTAFNATSYAANEWRISGSPRGPITPSVATPLGGAVKLTSAVVVTPVYGPTKGIVGLAYVGTNVQVTINAHGYSNGDTIEIFGCLPSTYNGTYTVTVLDADTFAYVKGSNPGAASALGNARKVASSSSAQANIFRGPDVGAFVKINGGLVRITQYNSAIDVDGVIEQVLNTAVTAPTDAWSINYPVWNPVDGYPGTGTFFQQRLYAGGTPGFPQTLWGSVIGEYFSYLLGTEDDAALAYPLASDTVNPILYLAAMESLVCLTYGGEFTVEGGVEKAITPTNIKVKPRSSFGCDQVRPVRVGNEELFVQRTGRAVRAIGYTEELGRWLVPDMSVLAEHLVRAGVRSTAWQSDPGKLVFAVREDGVMVSATYDRDQDVVGWARQNTDGAFESVATIPAGDQDQTWVAVRRVVGGVTVRFVERLSDQILNDAGILGTHPTGAAVWTGLAHLEGKAVDIVADGCVMPRQVVASGQITLSRNAKAVAIGLPYTSRIKLLPPEVTGQLGSAQGAAMDVGEIYLRVNDTIGGKVNGQVIPWREFGPAILDQAPEPYTGLKKVENLGWDAGESYVELTQEQPLPWNILSVIRKWTFNQG